MHIVAEAEDGEQAVRLALSHAPDAALIDLSMPVLDGFEAMARMTAQVPGVGLVALTGHDDADLIVRAYAVGARGYLLKDASGQELADTLRRAAAGLPSVGPVAAGALHGALGDDLPQEQADLLEFLAQGITPQEAATLLGVAPARVDELLAAALQGLRA